MSGFNDYVIILSVTPQVKQHSIDINFTYVRENDATVGSFSIMNSRGEIIESSVGIEPGVEQQINIKNDALQEGGKFILVANLNGKENSRKEFQM